MLQAIRFAYELFDDDAFLAAPTGGSTPPDISYNTPNTVDLHDTAALSPTNVGGAATSYSVPPGTLPAGLSLDTTTGEITGTYTAVGSFTATITATNADGSDPFDVDWTVNNIAPNATYPNTFVVLGRPATITPGNTGGAITSSSGGATLPSWATLNSDGTITGTPDALGTTHVTDVTVTNAIGSDASNDFYITVAVASSGGAASPGAGSPTPAQLEPGVLPIPGLPRLPPGGSAPGWSGG